MLVRSSSTLYTMKASRIVRNTHEMTLWEKTIDEGSCATKLQHGWRDKTKLYGQLHLYIPCILLCTCSSTCCDDWASGCEFPFEWQFPIPVCNVNNVPAKKLPIDTVRSKIIDVVPDEPPRGVPARLGNTMLLLCYYTCVFLLTTESAPICLALNLSLAFVFK